MTESSSSISSNAFSGPTDKRAPAPFEIRGTIAALIDSRSRTDRRMSRLWALIPALILWIFVFSLVRYAILVLDFESYWSDNRFYDLLTASYVACIPLFAILFGAMIYKSIRRTNLHLSREDSLRAAVMSFLRGESTAAGKESQVMDGLLSLSAFDGQSVTYEKRHNAVLWGVGIPLLLLAYPSFILLTMAMIESDGYFELALVGGLLASLLSVVFLVASFYILNSLMRTAYTHDVRWRGFTMSTMVVLHKLGMADTGEWRHGPAKERSSMLFVVLTLVTLGFFLFAWFYVLVEDMNKHLEEQHRFEDMLRKVVAAR